MERRPLVVERVDEAKADETGRAARRSSNTLMPADSSYNGPSDCRATTPALNAVVKTNRLPCFDLTASIPLHERTACHQQRVIDCRCPCFRRDSKGGWQIFNGRNPDNRLPPSRSRTKNGHGQIQLGKRECAALAG